MITCNNADLAAPASAVPGPVPAGLSGRALTGKIARLPHSVRQALNERLRDDAPYDEILSWLNALPAVRQVMEARFGGAPITKENLSHWRHGGYAFWLANETAKEAIAFMDGACKGIDQSQRDALTGQIALLVTARMAVELRKFHEMPEGPAKSEAWEKLVRTLVLLRRGEFFAEKMRVERAKLAALQEAQEVEKAPECEEEERERERRIMGFGGPNWNNVTKQWEGEGAEEMTERNEVQRMVVAELLRRKEARKQEEAKEKEELGIKKEEAAGGDMDGARPLACQSFSDGRSSDAATPELPARPETPGHPVPAPIAPSEAGRAPSTPQEAPNFLRDAKKPAGPPRLAAFRHPRTGALRHILTTEPQGIEQK